MRIRYFLIFLLLTSISCLNNQKTKSDNNFDGKQNNNLFIRKWYSIESVIPNNSVLALKSDSTFHYTYRACLAKGYSEGTWKINSKFIILNSSIIDSCLFLIDFGNNCEYVEAGNSIKSKLKKTIEDCSPINKDLIYFHFNSDSFYIKDDTLFHVQKTGSICLDSINIFVFDKK